MSSLKKICNNNIIISFSRKKCCGIKNPGRTGLNLEIKIALSSMLKPSSGERKTESTVSNYPMGHGLLTATYCKLKHKITSKTSSAAPSPSITATSLKAHTLPLMILEKPLSPAQSLRRKFLAR
ncbi:hypothetical protein QL285_005435 [Trifolium repens]|nr:hypothetical protein QL285_005435 [Trifolium repens]